MKNTMLNKLYPLIILGLFLSIASKANAATYYVAINGDDTKTTSQAQNISTPWKTIQKCLSLSTLAPGDNCLMRAGTYYESLTLYKSGSQTSRITLKNYNGETVTVNSGSSQTLVTGGRIHYYTIDGLRFIANYTSPGQGDYTIDLGKNIWDGVASTNGGNNGFIISNCYIEGAILFYGHNNLVENCVLNGKNNWTNGIQDRFAASHDNTYRNNTVHDYKIRGIWTMQYTDNITITGNTTYNNGEMGIDCDGAGHPVTRCFVKNNIIHDISGEGVGILLENTFNSTIENNTIYNIIKGIAIINYGINSNIYNSDAEYRTTNTNTTIQNNIIYHVGGGTNASGIICQGSPGGKALHNTIYDYFHGSKSWFGAITLESFEDYYCNNWEIKNNLISNAAIFLWFKSPTNGFVNVISDYNFFEASLNDSRSRWKTNSSETSVSFSWLQSQKQMELHSVFGNPLFVNSGVNNFRLQSSSPAINKGIYAGVQTDFDGNSRPQGSGYDIGAYEYSESNPTPIRIPTPTRTPTPTPPPAGGPGDGNNDGHVTGTDYIIWMNNYGQTTNLGPLAGDYFPYYPSSPDRVVDGQDYIVWMNHYGL